MDLSLYGISRELNELMEKVFDAEGEINEELEASLDHVKALMTEKTDNIVHWVEYQTDLIKLVADKIKTLKEFKDKIEARQDKFDEYVIGCLKTLNTNVIEGSTKKIAVHKPRKVVVITDESKIPLDYLNIPKPKTEIDLKKIAKDLGNGALIPGAEMGLSKNIPVKYGWK